MGLFNSIRGGQAQLASTAFDKKITVPDDSQMLSLMSLPLTNKGRIPTSKTEKTDAPKALPGRLRDNSELSNYLYSAVSEVGSKHQRLAEESGNVEEYLKNNASKIQQELAPFAALQVKIESNMPILEEELKQVAKIREDKDYMSTPFLSAGGQNISVEFSKPLSNEQANRIGATKIGNNRYLMPFDMFDVMKSGGSNSEQLQKGIKKLQENLAKETNAEKKKQIQSQIKQYEDNLQSIRSILGTDEQIKSMPNFNVVEGGRTLQDLEQRYGLTPEGDIQSADWGERGIEQSKEISEAMKMFEGVAAKEVTTERYPQAGLVDGVPVLMTSTDTFASNEENMARVSMEAYNNLTTNQELAFKKEYLRDVNSDASFLYYEGVETKDAKGNKVITPTPVYRDVKDMSFDNYIKAKLESAANLNKRVTKKERTYDYSNVPEYLWKAEQDKTKTTLYSVSAEATAIQQADPDLAKDIFEKALGGTLIKVGDKVTNEAINALQIAANDKNKRDAFIDMDKGRYNEFLKQNNRIDTDASKTVYYQNSIKDGVKNIYKSGGKTQGASAFEKLLIRFNLNAMTKGISAWFISSPKNNGENALGGILAIENYDAYEIPLTPEYKKTYALGETMGTNTEVIANDGTVTNLEKAGIDPTKVVYIDETPTLIPNFKYNGQAQSTVKIKVMMPPEEAKKLNMRIGLNEVTGEEIVGPNNGKIKYTTVKESGLAAYSKVNKDGETGYKNEDWVVMEMIIPINSSHQHELAKNEDILYGTEGVEKVKAEHIETAKQMQNLENNVLK